MKKLLVFILLGFSAIVASAQLQAGWHILKPGASYCIVMPSGTDIFGSYDMKELATMGYTDLVYDFEMAGGEVVNVIDKIGDAAYCSDPLGRIMFIKQSDLIPVEKNANSGIVNLTEDIDLLSGDTFQGGMYLWAVGQNVAQKTITVQLPQGNMEIPSDKCVVFNVILKKLNSECSNWRTAQ